MRFPRTLFAQTVATIAAVSLAFLIFTLAVIGYFMLVPVGKSSAEDLASLMVLSSQTWSELSPPARLRFEENLAENYQLRFGDIYQPLPAANRPLPYYFFLESALARRTGQAMRLKISEAPDGEHWFWADVPNLRGSLVRIGFPRSHITAKPPLAMILLLIVGSLATLVTAAALARYITKPLERFSVMARHIGSGDKPEPIPVSGPDELASLAHSFNEMAEQVQQLLSNRTTLLAGISHDLRTPMARIQLALEMLPDDIEPDLMAGIRGDLDQMNCLIGQFLELSRGLEKGEQQSIDIAAMLDELIGCARRGGASLSFTAGAHCQVTGNPLALRRIVVNLLDNAVRYGGDEPIVVVYQCADDAVTITITDRGPGIPADQLEAVFRPFYRLEQSRNSNTGGSGLGLSIARQLADFHHIRLELSPHETGGTRASLCIPCTPPPRD